MRRLTYDAAAPPPLRQMKAPMRKRKLKRGGYGGWELRTFVLKDGMLIYFKDADAARCQVWEDRARLSPRAPPPLTTRCPPACLPACLLLPATHARPRCCVTWTPSTARVTGAGEDHGVDHHKN
eukprot:COSAG01_NODE_2638_length_7292_cov_8.034034_5_plen_124_part_00